MIASGIATILQARANSKIGSGYLYPFSCGPAYLGASILAGKTGGLPLIFGLTTAAGLFEGVLSRLLQYLRVLFPPEVTGLVVSMVGIELVGLGCPRFLGYAGGQIDKRATIIACLTLAAMIGPTVWGKGKLTSVSNSAGPGDRLYGVGSPGGSIVQRGTRCVRRAPCSRCLRGWTGAGLHSAFPSCSSF